MSAFSACCSWSLASCSGQEPGVNFQLKKELSLVLPRSPQEKHLPCRNNFLLLCFSFIYWWPVLKPWATSSLKKPLLVFSLFEHLPQLQFFVLFLLSLWWFVHCHCLLFPVGWFKKFPIKSNLNQKYFISHVSQKKKKRHDHKGGEQKNN